MLSAELLNRIKALSKRLDNLRLEDFKSRMGEVIATARPIAGVKVISQVVKGANMELLRVMVDLLRQKIRPALVVLASVWEERVLLVCALSPELIARGLDATRIIRTIARDIDGSGGGRPDFAQAGGRNPKGLQKALMRVEETAKKELKDYEAD